jgi:hypothetical protein
MSWMMDAWNPCHTTRRILDLPLTWNGLLQHLCLHMALKLLSLRCVRVLLPPQTPQYHHKGRLPPRALGIMACPSRRDLDHILPVPRPSGSTPTSAAQQSAALPAQLRRLWTTLYTFGASQQTYAKQGVAPLNPLVTRTADALLSNKRKAHAILKDSPIHSIMERNKDIFRSRNSSSIIAGTPTSTRLTSSTASTILSFSTEMSTLTGLIHVPDTRDLS